MSEMWRTSLWHLDMPEDELYALLIKAACPIVCDEVSREPDRWHDLCEEKAKAALEILHSIHISDSGWKKNDQ
jgi:hypothetical protein